VDDHYLRHAADHCVDDHYLRHAADRYVDDHCHPCADQPNADDHCHPCADQPNADDHCHPSADDRYVDHPTSPCADQPNVRFPPVAQSGGARHRRVGDGGRRACRLRHPACAGWADHSKGAARDHWTDACESA
jgi:hypothetical protein